MAWRLKKKFPHLVWIADFRDPFFDEDYPNTYWPGLQRRIQRKLLKKADLLTTVSYGLARHYKEYGRPIYVLRNGINQSFQKGIPRQKQFQKFTISYTGSLYPERQSAIPLFKALKALLEEGLIQPDTFQLCYTGKSKATWDLWVEQHGLESISKSSGERTLQAVFSIQRSSQVNLLLTWSGPLIKGILTGKLYEYLAAQRPIIGIINGPQDKEVEAIFEQLQAGKVHYVDQSDPSLKQQVQFLFQEWLSKGEISWAFDQQTLREFEWDTQLSRFCTYLKEEFMEKTIPDNSNNQASWPQK